MAYNQKFYKTESATAHSLTSCAAGTRGVGAYTASAESIISQRDTDRKALVWAQAAAQSLVTCRPDTSVSALNVTPVEGLDSIGEAGGPFAPDTLQYTVQNFGNEDCNWQCNASESWVTVSATSGFLYVGESAVVTIGLDAVALSAGIHTATITFFNASTGIIVTTRQVVLEVTSSGLSGCPYTISLIDEALAFTSTPCDFVLPSAGTLTITFSMLFNGACSSTFEATVDGDPQSQNVAGSTMNAGSFVWVIPAAGTYSLGYSGAQIPGPGTTNALDVVVDAVFTT